MAVELLIEENGEKRALPVASNDVFRSVWLRAAAELGLVWVPLWETGAPIDLEDRPTVVEELRRLRRVFEASEEYREPLSRLDRLLAEVERSAADSTVELYIG